MCSQTKFSRRIEVLKLIREFLLTKSKRKQAGGGSVKEPVRQAPIIAPSPVQEDEGFFEDSVPAQIPRATVRTRPVIESASEKTPVDLPPKDPTPIMPLSIKEAAITRIRVSFLGRFFAEKKVLKETGMTTHQRVKRYDAQRAMDQPKKVEKMEKANEAGSPVSSQ